MARLALGGWTRHLEGWNRADAFLLTVFAQGGHDGGDVPARRIRAGSNVLVLSRRKSAGKSIGCRAMTGYFLTKDRPESSSHNAYYVKYSRMQRA
jgi:hypothetical protein